MVTQAELKRFLEYDPNTGVFTRLISTSSRAMAGNAAGAITGRGYLSILIGDRRYYSHRLAFLYMTGEWPPEDTDHINGIKNDNRWINLRSVSREENMRNTMRPKRNTTGIIGVCPIKRGKKNWESYITVNGKDVSLGKHLDFFEACCARKSAENKYGFHPNHGRSK